VSRRSVVLVTGGAGFIGSHLVDALVASGERVRVLDDMSSGREENLSSSRGAIEWLRGDVTDPFAAFEACRGAKVVFHLAARVSVPESFERPELYERICGHGTKTLLEAAHRAGVARVVYAGSSSAYGDAVTQPIEESAPLDPLSPYAHAKLTGEEHCVSYSHHTSLETVRLRFFNVYGERQDPSSPYAGVISKFLELAVRGETPTIHGDGLQTRDFVYVGDVVRALRKAAVAPEVDGEVFNVGRGAPVTVRQLSATIGLAFGNGRPPRFGPARRGDVRHSCANTRKAGETLGFRARVPLALGLERTAGLHRPSLPAS
jgi:UDP-glucose 4-epimerase